MRIGFIDFKKLEKSGFFDRTPCGKERENSHDSASAVKVKKETDKE